MSHSAFQSLIPDCRDLIFQYFIYNPRPHSHHQPFTFKSEDEKFVFKRLIRCWELMTPACNVGDFLRLTAHKSKSLHYLYSGPNETLTDKDFHLLKNIKILNIWGNKSVSSRAFRHLRGIHTLHMSECDQEQLDSEAFQYLEGIHTLYLSHCTQSSITPEAFKHLRGIHTLFCSGCYQLTDEHFQHVAGVHTLEIKGCHQLTDRTFEYIRGVRELSMNKCSQETITDRAFEFIGPHIEILAMDSCSQRTITPRIFAYLRNAKMLYFRGCEQFNDLEPEVVEKVRKELENVPIVIAGMEELQKVTEE